MTFEWMVGTVDESFGQELSLTSISAVESVFNALAHRERGDSGQYGVSVCNSVDSLGRLVETLNTITLEDNPSIGRSGSSDAVSDLLRFASSRDVQWGADPRMSDVVSLLSLEAGAFRDAMAQANGLNPIALNAQCPSSGLRHHSEPVFPFIRVPLLRYLFMADMISQISRLAYR